MTKATYIYINAHLKADLALEGLDTGVDVCVLLEARGGGEGLPTLGTCVAACADVLRADVALKVGRIGKYLKISGFGYG